MKYRPVTDEEIDAAFRNTNFGDIVQREFLELSVLKVWLGFGVGSTINRIMFNMGLTRHSGITARGKEFLRTSTKINQFLKRGG